MNNQISLLEHFTQSVKELKSDRVLKYRVLAYMHVIISISLAQFVFFEISMHKIWLLVYIMATLQWMLWLLDEKVWKELSLMLLSLLLFFAVFLVKYNEVHDVSILKNIYHQQNHLKKKHANNENDPIIWPCV